VDSVKSLTPSQGLGGGFGYPHGLILGPLMRKFFTITRIMA